MPKKQTRHMVRADNKTQTSISLRADLLDLAKQAAEQEGRSLSNWLEQELKRRFSADAPEPEPPPGVASGAEPGTA